MSSCDITRSVSVKASPQLGKQLATNNHAVVLADPIGARCYHCLGKPKITVATPTCDGSTVFCPLCRIDAIVPASQIPHPIERNLKYWNTYWFSTKFFDYELEYDEESKVENSVERQQEETNVRSFFFNIDDFPVL